MKGISRYPSPLARQRGVTLIVGLIMLVLMTLLAVSAFNLGKTDFLVVSNTQTRNEALAAANGVIEEVVSNPNFVSDPLNPIPTGGNIKNVDVNGDGTNDVSVTITKSCTRARLIPQDELDVEKDSECFSSPQAGQAGVVGAEGANLNCAETLWDVHANGYSEATRTKVEVVEGVQMRVSKDVLATSCS